MYISNLKTESPLHDYTVVSAVKGRLCLTVEDLVSLSWYHWSTQLEEEGNSGTSCDQQTEQKGKVGCSM